MTQMISLLLLAFAVSLDSFSVGFTYGLRKMRIPFKSIIIIACCSAASLMAAMAVGRILVAFLSTAAADRIGGLIFVLLGAWILFQVFRPAKTKDGSFEEKTIVNFEIKSLGLAVNILRKPMAADLDKSGTITGIEAVLLGLALSFDAFGAGVGAAMLGFSPLYLAVTVAVMSSLFVFIGMRTGSMFSTYGWLQKFSFVPGILLIMIGIWKM
ncbi:sporulation membrane protein YtaF [Bacillus canaveralius]|uniref:Sporulation membrane protein YtaF n=1 Tax=Bacillus canaveralius TaxID=1403243 RepID=A0A2N5GJP9_9BACI|nr:MULTISPECIES: sporulation membrane protein YtaF [Bacillus]PLR81494.1 sporulation membrane protein YtaF [Bacillus canaveralius]PLR82353.1 sporulation membrane protein YtaF [Bacillus sp. V33-4]PLR93878.1 sporulation membrane protein YtaF [Bacillus canaveralius]RSK52540.1 sporulation membrane protein YtaF [Bacillus canaveralius]